MASHSNRGRRALAATLLAVIAVCVWLALSDGTHPQPVTRAALRRPVDSSPGVTAAATPTIRGERANVGPPLAASGAFPRPQREVGEWQGMLVDYRAVPYCERSEQCGMARACVAHECVGCADDGQCAPGESCVLEHCLPVGAAKCRSRKNCAADEVCALSEYSVGPRGNVDMVASCVGPRTGASAGPPVPAWPADPRTELPGDKLINRARAARSAAPQPYQPLRLPPWARSR